MKVSIPVEADTAGLRAEVRAAAAAAERTDIDLDVGADTSSARAETQAFAAQVAGMDTEIDVGADTAPALTQANTARTIIDAMTATIKVDVDVDQAGLGGVGAGAGAKGGTSGLDMLTKAFGAVAKAGGELPGLLGSIGGAVGSILSTSATAAQGMFSLGSSMLGLGRVAGTAAAGAAGLAVAIVTTLANMVKFGAQASIVAAALGAITAAAGAAGAAVSGLPALLLGVAAAGAAVALGMDGIKKAAEAAKPAFEQLKRDISGVFEAKLTPMFRDLGERVIPQLTGGLKAVADSVSNVILELADVATSAAGIEDINQLFGNTQVLLSQITPSLKRLVQVFLQIGATTGVFRELGGLISVVVGRISELFARFAEGGESSLMVRSLEQLKLVLDAALGAINALILGATEFFTAAGPGLREMFASIQRVIEKIDFESLGLSFGVFAGAVGRFFESIPQSTWDALAKAVQDLALKFKELADDPGMQDLFNTLIMLIPTCINMFTDFLGAVRAVVNFVQTAWPIVQATFETVWNAIKVAGLAAAQVILSILQNIAAGVNVVVQAMPFLPQSFRDASQGAVDALGGMREGVGRELESTVADIRGHGSKANSAGRELGEGAADGATNGISPMDSQLAAEAKAGVGAVQGQAGPAGTAGTGVGDSAFTGAREGFAPMPGQMGQTAADGAGRIRDERGGFNSAGRDVAAGAEEGIASGRSGVIQAAINIARAAWQAAKDFLGIASPSKLFRYEVGAFIPAGMALGIQDQAALPAKAVTAMVSGVATAAQRAIAVDPGLKAAAQELLNRVTSGGQVFEDLSFRGMSANLGKFNDQLADMFYASGKSLREFLSGLAASSAAVQAGQSVGQQIVKGLDKTLKAYTVAAPSISMPGVESKAFDHVTDHLRQNWQGTLDRVSTSTPGLAQQGGGGVEAAVERALSSWTVELTPEGVARLNKQGERALARR